MTRGRTRMLPDSAERVVQRQLEAYNAKDVEGILATYAADAQQFELGGNLLASGQDQLRQRFAARFAEPDLHAELLGRMVMGNMVIDHERVRRNFPEGPGTIELLAIYELSEEKIRRAWFAFGEKTLG